MNSVCVNIDIPKPYYNKAKYIFSLYSIGWGIPVLISRNCSDFRKTDIYYTDCPTKNCLLKKQIIIPFDKQLYEKKTVCGVNNRSNFRLWGCAEDINSSIDVVASTYRLLNFLDESQVSLGARDNKGIFSVGSLPKNRRGVLGVPLVESHIEFLFNKLVRNRPELKKTAIPRWPNGKKYAIALTHDTDATNIGAPKEILTNSLKFVIKRNWVYLKMVQDGLKFYKKPNTNPYFSFRKWGELESKLGMKSCFYLHTKPVGVKRHLNDCKSDSICENFDWGVLKQLSDDGWEFGAHPSIHSKNSVSELQQIKSVIEQRLGVSISGLRHHYWSLDWFMPYLTFRNHVESGYEYDTSVAWKDCVGFRAGTCLPFQPFDPIENTTIDLYELPTCLMDGHVMSRRGSIEDKIILGKKVINEVKNWGGVAVLDWHTETLCNNYVYKNYINVLEGILNDCLKDSNLWIATPGEIVEWWRTRSSLLRNVVN